jgi:hypothetical protein
MQARSASKGFRPDERLTSLFTPHRVDSMSLKHVEEPMKILIGVDGSASSLDAVRMVGRLVDPSRDEVAVYFSPMELEKRLIGRSQPDHRRRRRRALRGSLLAPAERVREAH